MPQRDRELLTVSPPTYDRTEFAALDRALSGSKAPYDREWLMRRFDEGLQIRMLRAPLSGFVVFQPGRLAWRPIVGAERAIVVHDLRVAPGEDAARAKRQLWSSVESFARYYGYAAILALSGPGDGLIAPDAVPQRGWITLDHGPGESRLLGRILQGPMALPHLPTDWSLRAALVGPGLVIQSTGECGRLNGRIAELTDALRRAGLSLRHDRLRDAATVRSRAVTPGAVYSVLRDGERIGGPELSAEALIGAAIA